MLILPLYQFRAGLRCALFGGEEGMSSQSADRVVAVTPTLTLACPHYSPLYTSSDISVDGVAEVNFVEAYS
jgi:hypothetical protein